MIPEISVLIPIYNVEKYIERCLRSVFSQTIATKAEFILVNDNTPDNSMAIAYEVIRDYPSLEGQIHIINHSKNKGLAAARQTALQSAKGKYIQIVDSDDWCEPEYLECLYNQAIEKNADIVTCNVFLDKKESSCVLNTALPSNNIECIRKLLTGEISSGLWYKFIKTEIITRNNVNWIEGLNLREDMLFSCKVFYYSTQIVSINKPLYHYCQNTISMTATPTRQKWQEVFQIYNEIETFLNTNAPNLFYNELLKYRAREKCKFLLQSKTDEYSSYKDYRSIYPTIKLKTILPYAGTIKSKIIICLAHLHFDFLAVTLVKIWNGIKKSFTK